MTIGTHAHCGTLGKQRVLRRAGHEALYLYFLGAFPSVFTTLVIPIKESKFCGKEFYSL